MEPSLSASALMTCGTAPLPTGKMPGSRPGRDGVQGETQTSSFTPFSISHKHWRLNFKNLQDRRQKKVSSIFPNHLPHLPPLLESWTCYNPCLTQYTWLLRIPSWMICQCKHPLLIYFINPDVIRCLIKIICIKDIYITFSTVFYG